MSHHIQAAELRAKVARIIEQAGSTPAEAAQGADNLVMANLSGHDSHGVGMVPHWCSHVPMALPWYAHGVAMVLPWCSHGVAMMC